MPQRALKHYLLLALSLSVFLGAIWALQDIAAHLSWHSVRAQLLGVPAGKLLAACFFTALSYFLLTFYDWLAIVALRQPLSYPKAALASFLSFSISHTVGVSLLSSASIRFRYYMNHGVDTLKIAAIQGFTVLTFALGQGGLLACSLLFAPTEASGLLRLDRPLVQALGAAIAALILGYLLACGLKKKVSWRGRAFGLPPLSITLAQLLIATLDLGFSATVPYVLLPGSIKMDYLGFVSIYVLATQLGALSNVPGGLGVFESVFMLSMPKTNLSGAASAVLLYRLIYYLVPFALGLAVFAVLEARHHGHRLQSAALRLQRHLVPLMPDVLAIAVFLAGAILLISGATPGIDARLAWLRHVEPFPLLEASHLLNSAIGVALLILARGIHQRLDGAWWLTMVLLAAGSLASLLKGLDWEEATVLLVILLFLWRLKARFHRRASLLQLKDAPMAWVLAMVSVVALTMVLTVLTHRHMDYSHELWWQLPFDEHAPRSWRATFLAVMLSCGYALWLLLSPAPPKPSLPSREELEKAKPLAFRNRDTLANLALLGDKQILFAEEGDAFIMYQHSGRSTVALGDPVGNPDRFKALAWRFIELCHRHASWPVFYQVTVDHLPLYLDLGLSLAKLGEEARVYLPGFSLEGRKRHDLRNEYRRALKAGARFEIIAAPEVTSHLPRLKEISDWWLSTRAVAEKGFSVGYFHPDYLCHFPCAVVSINEQIVAFANLWPSCGKDELSIDLMRYGLEAPKGVMDYLFIELMLWGKKEGYLWFNLGMAPLSGLERHPMAPFWHKLGQLVHRYGEKAYNFAGLRRYKEKFHPHWRPRYLASPGGLSLPRVLFDTAVLIAGGIKEMIWK